MLWPSKLSFECNKEMEQVNTLVNTESNSTAEMLHVRSKLRMFSPHFYLNGGFGVELAAKDLSEQGIEESSKAIGPSAHLSFKSFCMLLNVLKQADI